MRGVAERGSEVKEASAAQFRSLSITDKSVLCVCVGTGFGIDDLTVALCHNKGGAGGVLQHLCLLNISISYTRLLVLI